jgi:peptide/nickel transport system substrate-binding protein
MRKYYWYFTGYLQKHGNVLLTSIIVAVIVFSLFIPRVLNWLEQKERVYIGMVGSYTLDQLPDQVSNLISAGLTNVEPDGTVSPSVAERWIIEDDGKTYRFVVKKNLVWQDSKPLTTADLSYNFKDVEVITTPNEIVFKLPEQFVPFPSSVAQPLIRYIDQRHNFFAKRRMPVGLSTFQVTDYKEENGKLKEITIDSANQRRIYRFYLTEQQAVTAFKHGQVDSLTDFSSTYDIFEWEKVSVAKNIRQDRYTAVFFDNANPKFDENIRQALAYSLPKVEGPTRAIGPISPQSWVYLDSGKSYAQDQDRALERLFSKLPGQPLHFELVTTSNFQTQAEEIKNTWEELGRVALERCPNVKEVTDKNQCPNAEIKVTIRVSNFPDTSNFEAMLVGQQIPSDPDQYYLWHSEQNTNFTHYKNTRIDALLEKGRTTAEAEERRAIYQEFQQFFLEDAPAIFLEFLPSYEITRK